MPLVWRDDLTYKVAGSTVWFVNGHAMYIMLDGEDYSVAFLVKDGRQLTTIGPFPTFEAAKAVAELNK